MRAVRKLKQSPCAPSLPELYWLAQTADHTSNLEWTATIPDRTAFEALSSRNDVPGMLRVREVKFLVTDVDTDAPKLYFMNSVRNSLHFPFARDHLKLDISHAAFNRTTYFTENRRFIAGTIIDYDTYQRPNGSPGVYALEFWPTDRISPHYIVQTYHLIKDVMGFAAKALAYHPAGDIQERLFAQDEENFAAQSIATISTSKIFEGISYSPLNLDEAIGTLRLMTPDDPHPPSATNIVIFETLPNDLPLVAGVISAAPQTPL